MVRQLLAIATIGLSVLLVASAYIGLLNPAHWWLLPALGFAYTWLMLLTAVWATCLLLLRPKLALVPALAMICTIPSLLLHLRLPGSRDQSSSAPLKLISYNVRNFDLYNWSQEGVLLEKIIKQISDQRPDVACFQEFFHADSGVFRTIDRLQRDCGLPYYAVDKTVERENYGFWGLAVFSRHPIVYQRALRFGNKTFNSALLCGLSVAGDTLWVLNVHLQSIALEDPDYSYLQQVGSELDFDVGSLRSIARKLLHGFRTRPHQAERVHALLDSLSGPVVLCGDFNDTPGSYVYRLLTRKLKDAFLQAGSSGLGKTYAGVIPMLRIDYILVNEQIEVNHFEVSRQKLSDHYLICCRLSVKP
ncbi:MAG: endonuclease/exonuclease/phosphatase family protein [Chitinophagales bacterium]|nr:endonuclease/exonuclease/phosphatase family protein [Chitinophagales bacterium]MDW8427123.1 endonuclease/exonuclease/phosphatase family protein [Chitinophagales bacterium]